jgi:hypothetical protein
VETAREGFSASVAAGAARAASAATWHHADAHQGHRIVAVCAPLMSDLITLRRVHDATAGLKAIQEKGDTTSGYDKHGCLKARLFKSQSESIMIELNDVNLFAASILATCYIILSLAANKFKIWTVLVVAIIWTGRNLDRSINKQPGVKQKSQIKLCM